MSRSLLVTSATVLAAAALVGCSSHADSSATAAKHAEKAHISSSITEGAQLSKPVLWRARVTGVPTDHVAEVRFLIDGKLRHVERESPYDFAGLGNQLLPGTLAPGTHSFAVDALLSSGPRLTTASTATISDAAQGVPHELLGRWTRTVTAPEVRRTDDFRQAESGEPLPVGTWTLRIGADGVARYLDPTPTHDITVGQVRFQSGGRLVVGNEIPNFPHASEGGFCPDTVAAGSYRWSLRHGALVVRVIHDRGCADRNSFWNGSFTR